ncbi:MAG: LolA family protein [Jatrophihabitantaceae bacterium]
MTRTDILSGRGRRRLAWALPVVVGGGVAVAVAVTTAASSGASPTLKPRSAQQLLVAVQTHATTALSGEVRESMNLGLPSLPGDRSAASLSWQSFLTGSHTMRVWVDGADKQRVALIGQLSEADVVHNGDQVWTYTSDSNSVSHSILRGHGRQAAEPKTATAPESYTPAGLTARVLKAIRPSTTVTVDSSQTVAGQPAYTLVLGPNSPASTVSQVRIAIDANRLVPLQVQVLARGSSAPVLTTGFRKISYHTPPASVFNFHKPAGSPSSGNPFSSNGRYGHHEVDRGGSSYSAPSRGAARLAPKIIGSDWTTVVELDGASAAQLSGGLLDQLTGPVGSSGMRLMHTTLLNAVFTPDGRVFVGAVTPAFLERVVAAHPH